VQTNPNVVGIYKILNLKEKECATIWQVKKISLIKCVMDKLFENWVEQY